MNATQRCRLCMKTSSGQGIDLFKDCGGVIYGAKIKEELNIELKEVADWPRLACVSCIVVLQKISLFRNFVLENDLKLRLEGVHMREVQPPAQKKQKTEDSTSALTIIEESSEDVPQHDSVINTIDLSDSDVECSTDAHRTSPRTIEAGVQIGETPPQTVIDDFFSEIIEYATDEEYDNPPISAVEESPVRSTSTTPTILVEPKKMTKATPKATKAPTEPKRKYFSRVRQQLFRPLTAEEENLEAIMMDMHLFECNVCEQDCETLNGLQMHVSDQHDKKSYIICCKMGLFYASAKKLYDHIRFHLDKTAFICPVCGNAAANSSSLAQHISAFHPTNPDTFVCDICGESFIAKKSFKSHMLRHQKVNCKYCGKEYSSFFIQNHIKAQHEVEANYICEICGKTYPSVNMLNTHIMDHGGPHGGRRKKKSKPKVHSDPELTNVFDETYFASKH